MIEQKIARLERLFKALDLADGKEDFIIHRDHAIAYVKGLLAERVGNPDVDEHDLTLEELQVSLQSLEQGPPHFKRKNTYEIVESLLAERLDAKQRRAHFDGEHPAS